MSIARFSVNKPVTMFMIITAVIVLGIISGKKIPLLYLPEFSGSSLWVNVSFMSSSPEEIERLITVPLEDALGVIENMDSINSTSSSNNASVSLQFKVGADMRVAEMQVMNRINEIRASLPNDVERIRIGRFRSGDIPVLELQVGGNIQSEKLYYIIEKVIKRRLQRINGVASVETKGIEEKHLFVNLDKERLISHGVDARYLRDLLVSSNTSTSVGNIIDGDIKYTIRTSGNFKSVKDIERLPVAISKSDIGNDGQIVTDTKDSPRQLLVFDDLADIQYTFPEKTKVRRLHGQDAVTLSVIKSSNANTIVVVKDIKMALTRLQSDPRLRGLEINIYRDRAEPVIKSLSKLKNTGIIGGLLVIIVLFVFLRNIRSTVIVVCAIPVSILFTFCMMFILRRLFNADITINVVSLSGMMLAIGILVDPAIVVLENIFRHKNENGQPVKDAAVTATREVGLAITAATATTVAVFIPLVFLSKNRMGIFLHDFGVTLCLIVTTSLLVSLAMIPYASSLLLKKDRKKDLDQLDKQVQGKNRENRFVRSYLGFARITIKHKWITTGVAIAIVGGSVDLFINLDKEIVWSTPYRETKIWVDAPVDYNIDETTALFEKLEDLIDRNKTKLDIVAFSTNFEKDGGLIYAYLKTKETATLSIAEVREGLKNLFPAIPGVKYVSARRYGFGPSANNITVDLYGKNIDVLSRLAEKAKTELERMPYIKEVDTNRQGGTYELHVNIKRNNAHMYGLSPQRVAMGLSGALSSRAVTTLRTDDHDIDITLQAKEGDRDTLEKLRNLSLKGVDGGLVTVNRVAMFKRTKGPKFIERQDRKPTVTLSINYKGVGYQALKDNISSVMNQLNFPPDYKWEMGGLYRHYGKEEKELNFGLILAIIIIYLIMASLFESFVYPFTIMLTIPFAFTGVTFVFHFMDIPLNDFAQIGMILLVGIVVNNAIVLIDYINKQRNNGMERDDAILKGLEDRFRPILMTSITTILGLMPMVLPLLLPQFFGKLEGRERLWAPLGLVIVSGLTASTFLTLIILPTFYSLIDDIAKFGKRFITIY